MHVNLFPYRVPVKSALCVLILQNTTMRSIQKLRHYHLPPMILNAKDAPHEYLRCSEHYEDILVSALPNSCAHLTLWLAGFCQLTSPSMHALLREHQTMGPEMLWCPRGT